MEPLQCHLRLHDPIEWDIRHSSICASQIEFVQELFAEKVQLCKMCTVTKVKAGLPGRIEQLVKAAGSQRKLAKLLDVRDGTIIAWMAGSQPFDRTLEKIVDRTGVTPEWLIEGRGEPPEPNSLGLSADRRQVTYGADSGRFQESPPDMECPLVLDGPPARGAEKYMLMTAERMTSSELAHLIFTIVVDKQSSVGERNGMALRLIPLLTHKLAEERGQATKRQ